MQDENILLSVKSLRVKFDHHVILDDVGFDVKDGETLAVIGPNGAGKSVLFKALLDLVPYDGQINWRQGVKIGYVPQKMFIPKDLPLTTLEFLKLKESNKEEIYKALFRVGFKKNKPHEDHLDKHILKSRIGVLSGGEIQRVLIAFALLGHPDVLLFDEPTAGVDISAEETIYSLLHELQEKENLTIILISHELQIVIKYASNVICLNKEKVCYGSPKQVLDKGNLEKLYGGDVTLYPHRH